MTHQSTVASAVRDLATNFVRQEGERLRELCRTERDRAIYLQAKQLLNMLMRSSAAGDPVSVAILDEIRRDDRNTGTCAGDRAVLAALIHEVYNRSVAAGMAENVT